jgi:DNA-binding transcriptional LysR family regulator
MRRNRETMELRQVRHAIAISEEFTFTGAARRCGISQPTITNSIKKLEYRAELLAKVGDGVKG